MPAFKLGEREVRYTVLVFSILGLILLAVIGSLAEVPEVELSEVNDHQGERIWTRGIVVGSEMLDDGGERFLLYDNGATLEVFAERGAGGLTSGTEVRVKGEVFSSSGDPVLTVQSESSIERINEYEPSLFEGHWKAGRAFRFRGTIAGVQWNSYDDSSVLVRTSGTSGGNGSIFRLTILSFNEDVRTGDQLNIAGIVTGETEVLSFGKGSVIITGRSTAVSTSLERLIEDMRFTPEDRPGTPITLHGYLKYEPAGRSFYISDVPEGSTVSVKVYHGGDAPELHKGDLVEVTNCSLVWDPSGMRFQLEPEEVLLMERYGPWSVGLGSLEYGIEQFHLCIVTVEGYIHEESDVSYIMDQESRLEVRNVTSTDQGPVTVTGIVMLDPNWNSYYLEVQGAFP